MTLSSEESKHLHGETVPLDASPGLRQQFGFTMRVPCGVVAAISPFNFPLNLVCHKVGPALAAGNSVIIKPASDTPLSALNLTELLFEAPAFRRNPSSASPGLGVRSGMPCVPTDGCARSPSPAAATWESISVTSPG